MERNDNDEGSDKVTEQQVITENDICGQCFTVGNVTVVEQLPYGQAMQCLHDNGTKHNWTSYNSLASLGARKTGDPTPIICPKCGKKGMVHYYRPNPDRTDRVTYVVRHERIKGTWGKSKVGKIKRHYISYKEGKEKIRAQIDKKKRN